MFIFNCFSSFYPNFAHKNPYGIIPSNALLKMWSNFQAIFPGHWRLQTLSLPETLKSNQCHQFETSPLPESNPGKVETCHSELWCLYLSLSRIRCWYTVTAGRFSSLESWPQNEPAKYKVQAKVKR